MQLWFLPWLYRGPSLYSLSQDYVFDTFLLEGYAGYTHSEECKCHWSLRPFSKSNAIYHIMYPGRPSIIFYEELGIALQLSF